MRGRHALLRHQKGNFVTYINTGLGAVAGIGPEHVAPLKAACIALQGR